MNFKFGYTYLNNKLNELNQKNINGVTVLASRGISNGRKIQYLFLPQDMDSRKGFSNIRAGELDTKNFVLDNDNNLFMEMPVINTLLTPYFVNIKNVNKELHYDDITKLLKDKKQVKVTKKFLEQSENILSKENTFQYVKRISNNIYLVLDNMAVNEITNFKCYLYNNKKMSVDNISISNTYFNNYFYEDFSLYVKFKNKNMLTVKEYKYLIKFLNEDKKFIRNPNMDLTTLDDLIREINRTYDSEVSVKVHSIPIREVIDSFDLDDVFNEKELSHIQSLKIYNVKTLENSVSSKTVSLYLDVLFNELTKIYNNKYNDTKTKNYIAKTLFASAISNQVIKVLCKQ